MRELFQNTQDMSRVMHLQQVKFKICACHFTYCMKWAGEKKKTKEKQSEWTNQSSKKFLFSTISNLTQRGSLPLNFCFKRCRLENTICPTPALKIKNISIFTLKLLLREVCLILTHIGGIKPMTLLPLWSKKLNN